MHPESEDLSTQDAAQPGCLLLGLVPHFGGSRCQMAGRMAATVLTGVTWQVSQGGQLLVLAGRLIGVTVLSPLLVT
jgi:hypothetical protein